MPKAFQTMLSIPGIILFVLLFAMFPVVLQADHFAGGLHFHWAKGFLSIRDYLEGVWTGQSFRYLAGKTELSFWEQIGRSFTVTLFYMVIGSVMGMTVGVLLGIYFAVTRAEWLKRVLEMTSVLPEFLIAILLQFLIVFIASKTGLVIFQVASASSDDPAIVLPLLSTMIIPGNYMIRNVAMHMNQTFTEDYISYAKARGLGKGYITFYHALPNVLPFIKADLHKFLGLLVGNIFIIEYMYNLSGVTKLVFSNAFASKGYQYSLVVNGILTLLLLYALGYALLRLIVFGWEKVLVR